MPESPLDQPIMTIAPDGYVPKRMQLQKVKGSNPSLVQPEDVGEIETPTKASNHFIRRGIAVSGMIIGTGAGIYNGANLGQAVANENSVLALTSAAGLGIAAVGVGLNTFLYLRR